MSAGARAIVMARKHEVSQCRFLSVVYGGHEAGEFFAKEAALEKAANLRATHIVQLYDQGGKYTADAFNCQQPALPIAAGPSPAVEQASSAMVAPPEPNERRAEPARVDRPSWVVAVMEVEAGGSSQASIDAHLKRNVSDQLRIFVASQGVRTVDRGAQESTLRDQVQSAKGESYKGCYDDNCQIELGKALAASHILRAKISRFGSVCVLNGELIDLKSEVAISAASSRGDCEDEGFLRMSDEVATHLMRPGS